MTRRHDTSHQHPKFSHHFPMARQTATGPQGSLVRPLSPSLVCKVFEALKTPQLNTLKVSLAHRRHRPLPAASDTVPTLLWWRGPRDPTATAAILETPYARNNHNPDIEDDSTDRTERGGSATLEGSPNGEVTLTDDPNGKSNPRLLLNTLLVAVANDESVEQFVGCTWDQISAMHPDGTVPSLEWGDSGRSGVSLNVPHPLFAQLSGLSPLSDAIWAEGGSRTMMLSSA